MRCVFPPKKHNRPPEAPGISKEAVCVMNVSVSHNLETAEKAAPDGCVTNSMLARPKRARPDREHRRGRVGLSGAKHCFCELL